MYCTKSCFQNDWKNHCKSHPITSSPPGGSGSGNSNSTSGGVGTANYKDNTTPRKGPNPNSNTPSGKGQPGTGTGSEEDSKNSTATGGSGNGNGNAGVSTDDPSQWEHVGSEATYVPTEEDVGHVLMISVTALSQTNDSIIYGPMTIYTDPVLSAPRMTTKKNMIPVQLQQGQQPVSPGTIKFRILSYNILAELYATKQAYPYADSWLLSWPYRRYVYIYVYIYIYIYILVSLHSFSPPSSPPCDAWECCQVLTSLCAA
jgi:CCR4-NOT transcription complex subunit 6